MLLLARSPFFHSRRPSLASELGIPCRPQVVAVAHRRARRRAFVRQHCSSSSCPAAENIAVSRPWTLGLGARRIDRWRTWRQPGRSAFSGHAHPTPAEAESKAAGLLCARGFAPGPRIFPVPSAHRTVSYAYRIAWGRFVSARNRRKGTARMRARNRVPFTPAA